MTAEIRAEARRLRRWGWTYQQIGERFDDRGRSVAALKTFGRRLVHYEQSLEEAQAWKAANRAHVLAYDAAYGDTHRGVCEDCGGPQGRKTAGYNYRFCATCVQARKERNWRTIQLMWEDDASLREIAETLDWSLNHLGVEMVRMRRAGWDLPYRYNVQSGRRVAA